MSHTRQSTPVKVVKAIEIDESSTANVSKGV